jgi:hypothetical protein
MIIQPAIELAAVGRDRLIQRRLGIEPPVGDNRFECREDRAVAPRILTKHQQIGGRTGLDDAEPRRWQ